MAHCALGKAKPKRVWLRCERHIAKYWLCQPAMRMNWVFYMYYQKMYCNCYIVVSSTRKKRPKTTDLDQGMFKYKPKLNLERKDPSGKSLCCGCHGVAWCHCQLIGIFQDRRGRWETGSLLFRTWAATEKPEMMLVHHYAGYCRPKLILFHHGDSNIYLLPVSLLVTTLVSQKVNFYCMLQTFFFFLFLKGLISVAVQNCIDLTTE